MGKLVLVQINSNVVCFFTRLKKYQITDCELGLTDSLSLINQLGCRPRSVYGQGVGVDSLDQG